MKTIVSAKHTSLSPAMKSNAESSLSLLSTHYPILRKATCIMKVEKNYSEVEIIVSGRKLYKIATARHENMYIALHQAIDKLESQLEKVEAKKHKHGLSLGIIEAELSQERLAS